MSFFLKILLLPLTFITLFAQGCVWNTQTATMEDITPSTEVQTVTLEPDDSEFEKCSEITRGVLITHCGSCHQSTLDTHKLGAIAVFDLDKGADWHTSLVEENLEGISNRILNRSTITEEQKEAVALFLEIKVERLRR